jgi:DHA1 family tetracycline resistance protein-like MFS transporter
MFEIVRLYPALIWWAAVIVLFNFAVFGVNSIFAVYTSYRYSWSTRDIGIYLSAIGLWSMGAQSLLLPLILKRFKDRAIMIGGSIIMAATIAGAGLVPFGLGYAAFALVFIGALVVVGATINTFISNAVGPTDQGRTQGAARSLNSVVGLAAPGLFALLLAMAIRSGGKPLSGLPYVLSGVLTLIGLAFAVKVTRAKS